MTMRELAVKHGLGEHAGTIESLSRPCVGVVHRAGGRSTLGGAPRVPAGFTWPRYGKAPLSHLATIDLSEASRFDREGLLPKKGLLRFWYVQDQSTWGFDPKDAGSFRVEFIEDPAVLAAPAVPPKDVELFAECAIGFVEGWSLPNEEWIADLAPEHGAVAELPGYSALIEDLAAAASHHQMLGHASPVQCPMEQECELVTNGIYCGDSSGYSDPRAAGLAVKAGDWLPLLQLETDEDGPGWMWGDIGMLYFWIRREDLAARRFERCWAVLQCC